MAIKLTDRFLTSRKAPLKGRTIYTDSIVPGLTFRVSAATASTPLDAVIGFCAIGRADKDRGLLHSEPIPLIRWRRPERGQGRLLPPLGAVLI